MREYHHDYCTCLERVPVFQIQEIRHITSPAAKWSTNLPVVLVHCDLLRDKIVCSCIQSSVYVIRSVHLYRRAGLGEKEESPSHKHTHTHPTAHTYIHTHTQHTHARTHTHLPNAHLRVTTLASEHMISKREENVYTLDKLTLAPQTKAKCILGSTVGRQN